MLHLNRSWNSGSLLHRAAVALEFVCYIVAILLFMADPGHDWLLPGAFLVAGFALNALNATGWWPSGYRG